MCVAIPAEVVTVDGQSAVVDLYGRRFTVSLVLLDEPVQTGDFVALKAQHYAVSRIPPAEARETRRLFEQVFPDLIDPRVA